MKNKPKITYAGKKSPFNYEKFDSNSELAYAHQLETDQNILAWTKNHNIKIKYRNKKGQIRRYFPDFIVKKKNQIGLDMVEIKGEHLIHDPDIENKKRAAEDWCRQRGITYQIIVSQ